jgi:hypothetical protein
VMAFGAQSSAATAFAKRAPSMCTRATARAQTPRFFRSHRADKQSQAPSLV